MSTPQKITTSRAPEAVGPYSQAIRAGSALYVSGQIPLIHGTKQLVEGGIAEQTRQCLRHILSIVAAAGGDINTIVKTTIFMTDLAGFGEMNAAYSEVLGDVKPARATVGVASLPLNAQIEIEAIAYVPESR